MGFGQQNALGGSPYGGGPVIAKTVHERVFCISSQIIFFFLCVKKKVNQAPWERLSHLKLFFQFLSREFPPPLLPHSVHELCYSFRLIQ